MHHYYQRDNDGDKNPIMEKKILELKVKAHKRHLFGKDITD